MSKQPKTTSEHIIAIYGYITGLQREIKTIKSLKIKISLKNTATDAYQIKIVKIGEHGIIGDATKKRRWRFTRIRHIWKT